MRYLERRIQQIEQSITSPKSDHSDLSAWGKELLEMNKTDRVYCLRANLEMLDPVEDSWMCEIVADWIDFLELQGNPIKDPLYIAGEQPPEQIRWGEIHKRWGWTGWTGAGLPPQLNPDHWEFALS